MIQHETLPDVRDYLTPDNPDVVEPAPSLTPGERVTLVLNEDGVGRFEIEAMFLGRCDD